MSLDEMTKTEAFEIVDQYKKVLPPTVAQRQEILRLFAEAGKGEDAIRWNDMTEYSASELISAIKKNAPITKYQRKKLISLGVSAQCIPDTKVMASAMITDYEGFSAPRFRAGGPPRCRRAGDTDMDGILRDFRATELSERLAEA